MNNQIQNAAGQSGASNIVPLFAQNDHKYTLRPPKKQILTPFLFEEARRRQYRRTQENPDDQERLILKAVQAIGEEMFHG